ncbi:MAG: SpoIID/LytB domain-containing protein [Cyanobacteria bacterium SIG30]|nr:SpoIID/LytB domain-containing protein [Cyanobacteria bacterium SIG30]
MRKFFFIVLLLLFIQPVYAIRIGLQEGVRSTYVGASKNAEIIDGQTGKVLYEMRPLTAYTLKPNGNTFSIRIRRKNYKLKTNYIIIQPKEPKCFMGTKNRWYRGRLIVYNVDRKITVINELPLEEYLLGVVPSEMPYKWNFEAHKAQAIAARSYAVANMGKRGSKGYDLKDTPQDQAYGGISSEKPNTTQAVLQTKGVIMTHNNKIIAAYYHASSGGKTVAAKSVWMKDLPYIHSVNGYDSGIKKNGHGVGMSQHGANNLAQKGYDAYQILNYFYKDIKFGKMKTQL